MAQFKVGDRVRQVGDATWRGMTGIYEGIRQDNYGYDWEYFTPDANSTFADGSSHGYAGELCGMKVGSFEPVEATPPIPAAIAERMRGLIEAIVDHGGGYSRTLDEARAIMAELAPVDPDVLIARQVCGETLDEVVGFAIGNCDTGEIMRCALAAIRKGRELEREGR